MVHPVYIPNYHRKHCNVYILAILSRTSREGGGARPKLVNKCSQIANFVIQALPDQNPRSGLENYMEILEFHEFSQKLEMPLLATLQQVSK